MLLKEIKALFIKDLVIEWRQRYALNGLILYVLSSIFVCYLSFNLKRGSLNAHTWNALFWVIMLFNAIYATSKSFTLERSTRWIYYYSITSPEALIISRIFYNFILLTGLSLFGLLTYILLMGSPVDDMVLFVFNLVIVSGALSSALTLVSAISSKTSSSGVFMAILSLPLVLPVILLAIKISKNALDGLERSASLDELITLISINVIVTVLSLILFPYLWQS